MVTSYNYRAICITTVLYELWERGVSYILRSSEDPGEIASEGYGNIAAPMPVSS